MVRIEINGIVEDCVLPEVEVNHFSFINLPAVTLDTLRQLVMDDFGHEDISLDMLLRVFMEFLELHEVYSLVVYIVVAMAPDEHLHYFSSMEGDSESVAFTPHI